MSSRKILSLLFLLLNLLEHGDFEILFYMPNASESVSRNVDDLWRKDKLSQLVTLRSDQLEDRQISDGPV